MARIRSIKPEFFLHEGVASLREISRLAMIGLWTVADREGRLENRPKRIKAQIFPYQDVDMESIFDELEKAGFIHRYESDGGQYIAIPNFTKHQKPHPKEAKSTIPEPPSREKAWSSREKAWSSREKVVLSREIPRKDHVEPGGSGDLGYMDHGSGDLGSASRGVAVDAKGLYQGEDQAKDEAHGHPQKPLQASAPLKLEPSESPESKRRSTQAEDVFAYWKTALGKNAATVFDKDRKRAVESRLKDGYDVATLKKAIDGCKVSPFHQGENDRGKKFDDLELICRDAKHVDDFVEMATSPPKPKAHRAPSNAITSEAKKFHAEQEGIINDF